MRIAITFDNETKEVFQHFGETQYFLIVDTLKSGKITKIIDNGGFSHSALIGYLLNLKVTTLICGGLGNHAIDLLNKNGIEVIPGIQGSALEAADKYLKGELEPDLSVIHNCDCHNHQN